MITISVLKRNGLVYIAERRQKDAGGPANSVGLHLALHCL